MPGRIDRGQRAAGRVADHDRGVQPAVHNRLMNRVSGRVQPALRERRRLAVPWEIERDRSAAGGQRLQDGIPVSAVERELVKEDQGGTRCLLVPVQGGRETGPARECDRRGR